MSDRKFIISQLQLANLMKKYISNYIGGDKIWLSDNSHRDLGLFEWTGKKGLIYFSTAPKWDLFIIDKEFLTSIQHVFSIADERTPLIYAAMVSWFNSAQDVERLEYNSDLKIRTEYLNYLI